MKLKLSWLCWLLPVLPINAQISATDHLLYATEVPTHRVDQRTEAERLRWLAEQQADMGNAVEAQIYAHRAIDIFKSLGEAGEVIRTSIPLLSIHQQLHNGEKIIELALAGALYAASVGDTLLLIDMTTSLGIGYDECRQYHKALQCYLDCITLEKALGVSPALSYANASSTFTWMGRYDEARQYAVTAYQIALPEQDSSAMILAKLNEGLALAYLGRGDELLAVIAHTELLAANSEEADLPGSIAYLKSLAYATNRDFEKAYNYHKAFYQIDSAYSSAERNAHFAQIETLYQTQEKEMENARLNTSLARQRAGLVIVGSLLLLLGAITFFQYNRLKIRNKLLSAEKFLAETKRLHAAEQQEYYERELQDFTRIVIEKNQALEAFQAAITSSDSHSDQTSALQSELRQFIILTDADWRNFRQKFERVHLGFFEKFQCEVPDATAAELRLAALTKLELSNHEIAAMLGISPESVTKTRYRLRKKLGDRELEKLLAEKGSMACNAPSK